MTARILAADRELMSDIQLNWWVSEVAELTKPDRIVWCSGSYREWERLTSLLVEQGTFTRLNPQVRPDSFHCASDPSDVARVEDRTFICSEKQEDAGPTNNWIAPDEMRKTLAGLFNGCMRGRTMYVVPFCMGPLDGDFSQFGIEITDSPYVVVSMRIMTRMGTPALRLIEERGSFVRAVHSVGAPLRPGQADVNTRDFRCFRLFGVLWSSCSVSVLVPVFPVVLAVSGHGCCPRVAAGLARGSTVRVPGGRAVPPP